MSQNMKNIIAELIESQVIAEESQLIINGEDKEQTIALTEIQQLSTDGDIKYIPWFSLMLIPICIFLYALGSNLPTFLIWLLVTISGLLGLYILLAPPEQEFLVINMHKGESIRTPMRDKRETKLEFIRKTNVHIYSLNKK